MKIEIIEQFLGVQFKRRLHKEDGDPSNELCYIGGTEVFPRPLEVEEENVRAIHVYEKNGFAVLPYMEMKK